jgi:hypothetical protein
MHSLGQSIQLRPYGLTTCYHKVNTTVDPKKDFAQLFKIAIALTSSQILLDKWSVAY